MICCKIEMSKVTDSVVECLICGDVKYIAGKKRTPKVNILGRAKLIEYYWNIDAKYWIRISKLALTN